MQTIASCFMQTAWLDKNNFIMKKNPETMVNIVENDNNPRIECHTFASEYTTELLRGDYFITENE